MVRASARVAVPRLADGLLARALAELIRRWRELEFDVDGVLLHDGGRVEGLRLVSGRHHHVGAEYRVVATPKAVPEGEEPVDPEPVTLTVLAVAHDRLDFVVDLDELGRMAFGVENPARPTRITGSMDAAVPDDSPKFLHGPIHARGSVDLAAIPSAVAAVEHRRVSATADVVITADWVARTTATVRGGGLLRPLVGVLSPFLRGRFHAELRKSVDAAAARLVELDLGSRTPGELADRAFAEMIASLAKVVEPGE